jgi:hypothetical protein
MAKTITPRNSNRRYAFSQACTTGPERYDDSNKHDQLQYKKPCIHPVEREESRHQHNAVLQ